MGQNWFFFYAKIIRILSKYHVPWRYYILWSPMPRMLELELQFPSYRWCHGINNIKISTDGSISIVAKTKQLKFVMIDKISKEGSNPGHPCSSPLAYWWVLKACGHVICQSRVWIFLAILTPLCAESLEMSFMWVKRLACQPQATLPYTL